MGQERETCFEKITVFVRAVEDFFKWNKLPLYAEEQLKNISNQRVAAEKRAGFGLLCYGAEKLGIAFDIMDCYQSDTGKPLHPECWFSISHSNGVVSVAIAKTPVGVDIESTESFERVKRLEKKIVHKIETYKNPLELWTMKEAVFKLEGKDKIFRPAEIDTSRYFGLSRELCFNGQKFILSVSAETEADIEIDTNFDKTLDI